MLWEKTIYKTLYLYFQYSLLLVVVFLLEFLVGAVTYVYESQVDDELLTTLNKTFITSYGIDETRTNAIDLMQQNVRLRFLFQKYLLDR